MKLILIHCCLFFFLFVPVSVKGQVPCPGLFGEFRIENIADIPTVIDNGDGTLTLTHPDVAISAIFANYSIYNFYQSYPNTTPSLEKVYAIEFSSKQLMLDITNNVSSSIYQVSDDYTPFAALAPAFIQFVDGKVFNVIAGISYTDLDPCNLVFNCEPVPVPSGYDFKVSFNYDDIEASFTITNVGETPCGNSFEIILKSGVDETFTITEDAALQAWEVVSNNVINNQNCITIEYGLYDILGFTCGSAGSFINGYYTVNETEGTIRMLKPNALFGATDYILRDSTLGLREIDVVEIFVYQTKGNPYLQVANTNNQEFSVQIFDLNGRLVIENSQLLNNQINISALQKGTLYIVELLNTAGNKQLVKFLKQ